MVVIRKKIMTFYAHYSSKYELEERMEQIIFVKKFLFGKTLMFLQDESISYHSSQILLNENVEEVVICTCIKNTSKLTQRKKISKKIDIKFIGNKISNIENTFDCIVSLNIINNKLELDKFFEICKKKLNKNGIVVISVPSNNYENIANQNIKGFEFNELQKLVTTHYSNTKYFSQGNVKLQSENNKKRSENVLRNFIRNLIQKNANTRNFFERFLKKYLLFLYSLQKNTHDNSNLNHSIPIPYNHENKPTTFLIICNTVEDISK